MPDDDQIASVARALAHPARVHIVRLLATQSECRGAEVFTDLPLAQSTISEHLRVLKDAGIISSRPVGTSNVNCIVPEVLVLLSDALTEIISATPNCSTERKCAS